MLTSNAQTRELVGACANHFSVWKACAECNAFAVSHSRLWQYYQVIEHETKPKTGLCTHLRAFECVQEESILFWRRESCA